MRKKIFLLTAFALIFGLTGCNPDAPENLSSEEIKTKVINYSDEMFDDIDDKSFSFEDENTDWESYILIYSDGEGNYSSYDEWEETYVFMVGNDVEIYKNGKLQSEDYANSSEQYDTFSIEYLEYDLEEMQYLLEELFDNDDVEYSYSNGYFVIQDPKDHSEDMALISEDGTKLIITEEDGTSSYTLDFRDIDPIELPTEY